MTRHLQSCAKYLQVTSKLPSNIYLTEAGAYPQLPTQPIFFWSFSNLYSNLLWSFWVVSQRKIKIWIWGKKFSLLLKVAFSRQKRLQTSRFSNKLNFFPRILILIFLCETTQNDHYRMLYKFENDQKKFGCVGGCGYAPASVKSSRSTRSYNRVV